MRSGTYRPEKGEKENHKTTSKKTSNISRQGGSQQGRDPSESVIRLQGFCSPDCR